MTKFISTLLFLTLIQSACSPATLSPEAPPPAASDTPTLIPVTASTTESPPAEGIPVSTTEVVPPSIIVTVSTPHIDQGPDGAATVVPSYPQGCGYQWAYKDLPELSSNFQQSVRALQPEAQAVAFGFGEDCVHNDMSRTYIPMETDFNVTLQVSDPNDEAALGEWVVKIMQIIDAVPPEQISGPRPGRVGITFESLTERRGVSFYIDQYHALAAGLSYEEIYQAFRSQ